MRGKKRSKNRLTRHRVGQVTGSTGGWPGLSRFFALRFFRLDWSGLSGFNNLDLYCTLKKGVTLVLQENKKIFLLKSSPFFFFESMNGEISKFGVLKDYLIKLPLMIFQISDFALGFIHTVRWW